MCERLSGRKSGPTLKQISLGATNIGSALQSSTAGYPLALEGRIFGRNDSLLRFEE